MKLYLYGHDYKYAAEQMMLSLYPSERPEYPEGKPEELYDVMELNVNKLMPWGCGKSGIGANYKCLLCRIEKMTEEELAAAKAKELLRKNLGNGR